MKDRPGACVRIRLTSKTITSFIVPVIVVGLAILARFLGQQWFGFSRPYLQFFPAVIVATWIGGLRAGGIAMVLSAVGSVLFLPPATVRQQAIPQVVSLPFFLVLAGGLAALTNLFRVENRLRYLMGLAHTDGRLIRPIDEPTTAQVHFDWPTIHAESLSSRTTWPQPSLSRTSSPSPGFARRSIVPSTSIAGRPLPVSI